MRDDPRPIPQARALVALGMLVCCPGALALNPSLARQFLTGVAELRPPTPHKLYRYEIMVRTWRERTVDEGPLSR